MINIKAKKQNLCLIESTLQIPTEIVAKIKNNHNEIENMEKDLGVKLEIENNESGSFLKMSAEVPEAISMSDIHRFTESHQMVINNIAKLQDPVKEQLNNPESEHTHDFMKEDEPIMFVAIPVIFI